MSLPLTKAKKEVPVAYESVYMPRVVLFSCSVDPQRHRVGPAVQFKSEKRLKFGLLANSCGILSYPKGSGCAPVGISISDYLMTI